MIQRLAEIFGLRRAVSPAVEAASSEMNEAIPEPAAEVSAPAPASEAAAPPPEPEASVPASSAPAAEASAPASASEAAAPPPSESEASVPASSAPEAGVPTPSAPRSDEAPEGAGADDAEDQPNAALAQGDIPFRHPFREAVTDALRTVFDPEIPTNIYELGLIYELDIDAGKNVVVRMTLTAPGCPVAGEMPEWVRDAVAGVEGAGNVEVELVWDPPWDPSRMSEVARLETGFF